VDQVWVWIFAKAVAFSHLDIARVKGHRTYGNNRVKMIIKMYPKHMPSFAAPLIIERRLIAQQCASHHYIWGNAGYRAYWESPVDLDSAERASDKVEADVDVGDWPANRNSGYGEGLWAIYAA
jgi:hypothetical protein